MRLLFFTVLLMTAFTAVCGEKSDIKSLAVTEDAAIHLLENNDWDSVHELKEKLDENNWPLRAMIADNRTSLVFSRRGLLQLTGRDQFTRPGISHSKHAIYDKKARREVTAIDRNGRFMTHKHDILFKHKNKWVKVKTDLLESRYITAVYSNSRTVYVGTGLNGLYYGSYNNLPGKELKLKKFRGWLPGIYHNKSIKLREAILTINENNGNLYIGTGIAGGLYVKKKGGRDFKQVQIPFAMSRTNDVYEVTFSEKGDTMWVSTLRGMAEGRKLKGEWQFRGILWQRTLEELPEGTVFFTVQKNKLYAYHMLKNPPDSQAEIARRKKAAGRRMLYSSAYNYKRRGAAVRKLLKNGMYNGMVLDIKDDHGYIRYDSKVPFIKEAGAVRPKYDLSEVVEFMKKNDLYLTARIVVFKDPVLYRKKGYPVLDKRTGRPWVGLGKERWIDPFNDEVGRKYYIPLIKELEKAGIDEIQFDYIRFPSDGGVWNCRFSHRPEGMYYSEALENFLSQMRANTSLPISIDIYGYHGIYISAGSIGQDITAMSRHVDVVAPMLYSSHFGNSYMTDRPRAERAYALLEHSAARSKHLAAGRYLIRPWLQAFPMKTATWGYGRKYFLDQIKGFTDHNINGYMFWGSFKHLKRVNRDLYRAEKQ